MQKTVPCFYFVVWIKFSASLSWCSASRFSSVKCELHQVQRWPRLRFMALTLLLLRTSSRCHRLSATFTLPGNCNTTVPEPWLIFKVGVPSISSGWGESGKQMEKTGRTVSRFVLNTLLFIRTQHCNRRETIPVWEPPHNKEYYISQTST